MNFPFLDLIACSVCFGDPNDPQTKGLVFSILALLGVLVVVLGSLGKFFWNLRKREKINFSPS